MGVFDGIHLTAMRHTRDGSQVFGVRSFPPWRKRWYYVDAENEVAFGERATRATLVVTLIFCAVISVNSHPDLTGPRLLLVLLLLLPLNVVRQFWLTHGLARADIEESALEPVDRSALSLAQARAVGAPTLWGLIAAGVAMMALQVWVVVTDGVWWGWAGTAMFGTAVVMMARQLFLLHVADRREDAQ